MTSAQAELLRRCIEADRRYHTRKAAGDPIHSDERGIEIGWINGVNPRTAQALSDLGLVELLDLSGRSNVYAFLGKYRPYDDDVW